MSEVTLYRIKAIAKKEVVEFVRDWRTIMAIIVIPLLMFPLLFILFPVLLESEAAELDALELSIVIQSEEIDPSLEQSIIEAGIAFVIEPLPNLTVLSDPGEDLDRVRNSSVDAILRIEQVNTTWKYAILHLSTSERSNEAWNRLIDALLLWESEEVERRIVDSGLDVNATLDPLRWDGDVAQSDVATSGEQAGMVLSLFIPLVLAIWTYSSALQPSIDMTAGERERGTLEALLCLPCTRLELLLGKWVAVATITGVGVILQIFGLLFAIGYLASSSVIGLPELSVVTVLLLIADKLPELVKMQAEAIKNIKIDKVTVWDGGSNGGDGKSATAGFLSGLYKSVPPLQDMFDMAGMQLPEYLKGKDVEDAKAEDVTEGGK